MSAPDPFSAHGSSNYDVDVRHSGHATGYPVPTGGPDSLAPQTENDRVATASLIAGLLGTGPIALVLGFVGLRRTKDGEQGGRPMAWTGVALGVFSTIAWLVVGLGVMLILDGVEAGNFEDFGSSGSDAEEEVSYFDSDAQYGDNPELDALWDECEDGDMMACDDLFYASPPRSEYEEFGSTCGGRNSGFFFTCVTITNRNT